jgi:hypothetical protein
MTRHRSLHIGINYPGTACSLRGCVNDAENLSEYLVETGFVEPGETTVLREATCAQIVGALTALASESKKALLTHVFVSYSGHGASVEDMDGDEVDKRDECVCPSDYATAGVITDDVLKQLLRRFYKSTKITVLMDCCHSGSILDLPYRYETSRKVVSESRSACHPKVIMISGCKDAQTSADAYDDGRKEDTGAMTSSFLDAVTDDPGLADNAFSLLASMRMLLKGRGMTQVPQLSTSLRLTRTPVRFV